ncbi:hypothetical protein CEXT_620081 [Caerostris extrusa]|uniref:Uncharacterized protein n=1 Tax=Caerostris extrusa TaxID=172846 RepID=A0AAV4Y135_CAEEX|nr:hypothetical protein CEXT_620081 [Caerostris extrusa]
MHQTKTLIGKVNRNVTWYIEEANSMWIFCSMSNNTSQLIAYITNNMMAVRAEVNSRHKWISRTFPRMWLRFSNEGDALRQQRQPKRTGRKNGSSVSWFHLREETQHTMITFVTVQTKEKHFLEQFNNHAPTQNVQSI